MWRVGSERSGEGGKSCVVGFACRVPWDGWQWGSDRVRRKTSYWKNKPLCDSYGEVTVKGVGDDICRSAQRHLSVSDV